MTEERREDQSRLFRRDYVNEGYNTGKLSSSINDEDSFCISEDRRTAPRSEFFVSMRPQQQRPQPRKTVLDSFPGGGGLCSSESKHDRNTVPEPNSPASATLYLQSAQRKGILCSSPGEDGLPSETKHDRTAPQQNLYVSAIL